MSVCGFAKIRIGVPTAFEQTCTVYGFTLDLCSFVVCLFFFPFVVFAFCFCVLFVSFFFFVVFWFLVLLLVLCFTLNSI